MKLNTVDTFISNRMHENPSRGHRKKDGAHWLWEFRMRRQFSHVVNIFLDILFAEMFSVSH